MVTVGSVVVLLITVFGFGFDGNTTVPHASGKFVDAFRFSAFFIQGLGSYQKTNWLGIIAIVNISISIVGFFLFKDKK